jgi:hypothetical protein
MVARGAGVLDFHNQDGVRESRAGRGEMIGNTSPAEHHQDNKHYSRAGQLSPDSDVFRISLTYEGISRQHEVDRYLPVTQLVSDAATMFRINSDDVTLMLFGMHPQTLVRSNRISDPPRVGPGAIVLVFCIAGGARQQGGQLAPPGGHRQRSDEIHLVPASHAGGYGGTKILGNFKLLKFDGNA